MLQKKVGIVVPSNNKARVCEFLDKWYTKFLTYKPPVMLFLIEDGPRKTFNISKYLGLLIEHISWEQIDKTLGGDAWIIPRKTDCVRSFGLFRAIKADCDVIISLDDDCFPCTEDFIQEHVNILSQSFSYSAWETTIAGGRPRGLPYMNSTKGASIVLSHGLWKDIPDFDAITQLSRLNAPSEVDLLTKIISFGSYFPMCGMNVAYSSKVIPAAYFLLMGQGYPFDRFGDIWSGIFLKKIVDHLSEAAHSGVPWVKHTRASNVWDNLRKESPGYAENETLWKFVDEIFLTGLTYKSCYKQLAKALADRGGEYSSYWKTLSQAMCIWADLFS